MHAGLVVEDNAEAPADDDRGVGGDSEGQSQKTRDEEMWEPKGEVGEEDLNTSLATIGHYHTTPQT